MRILTLIAGLGLALLQAVPLDDAATARRKYDTLAAKAAAGDLTIDWRELRLDAVAGGVNSDFDWREQHKEVQAAFRAGQFEEGLKLAQPIIAHNVASLDGHFDAYIACKNLKQETEAAKEQAILTALLKSISSSGDGKSPATAFFVVDTSEEYAFLQLVAGMQPAGQSLVHQDGHDYDRMTVKGQGRQGVHALVQHRHRHAAEQARHRRKVAMAPHFASR